MRYLPLLLIVLLASCSTKPDFYLEKEFQDGNVKVRINATQAVAFDPWKVTLAVKAYTYDEGSLAFQITADELSESNIRFEWVDDSTCNIYFKERGGYEKQFRLVASPERVQMAEVKRADSDRLF
jgi:hypothetical protein